MRLTIVTPNQRKLAADVEEVTLPGGLGEMTILPGHTALLSTVEVGVVSFRQKEGGGRLAVNRGYVEVLDDAVTVLTHTAESPNDIDCARARRALERGRRRLAAAARDPGIDVVRAEYAVRRALARLAAAGEAAVQ